MYKGKDFEGLVRNTAKEMGIYYLRLQDTLKFSRDTEGARFVPKSPYDGVMYMNGKLFCLEMKTTEAVSLGVGLDKAIKTHQVEELNKAASHEGVKAGFLILFEERTTKRTHRDEVLIYLPIEKFNEIWEKEFEKKSISYNECIEYGYIIEKVKIGVRKMRYNLPFLDSIQ